MLGLLLGLVSVTTTEPLENNVLRVTADATEEEMRLTLSFGNAVLKARICR